MQVWNDYKSKTNKMPPTVSKVPIIIFQSTFSFRNSIDNGVAIMGPDAAMAAGVEVPIRSNA